jgi:hypothetical protein
MLTSGITYDASRPVVDHVNALMTAVDRMDGDEFEFYQIGKTQVQFLRRGSK